jgi:Na+-transporting NADH:ubiquinone oxidoreductase subunit NqrF
VQSITVTALANGDAEFVARCHGETETTTITRRQAQEGWRIAEAVAFKPPQE